jgi:hypothetical protein
VGKIEGRNLQARPQHTLEDWDATGGGRNGGDDSGFIVEE